MDITRKRIINPQRYLYALHPGDKFYIFSFMAFFLPLRRGSRSRGGLQRP